MLIKEEGDSWRKFATDGIVDLVRSGNGVVRLASLVQTRSLVPKYCGERTMIFLENPIIINNQIHDVIVSQNFRPRLCL